MFYIGDGIIVYSTGTNGNDITFDFLNKTHKSGYTNWFSEVGTEHKSAKTYGSHRFDDAVYVVRIKKKVIGKTQRKLVLSSTNNNKFTYEIIKK